MRQLSALVLVAVASACSVSGSREDAGHAAAALEPRLSRRRLRDALAPSPHSVAHAPGSLPFAQATPPATFAPLGEPASFGLTSPAAPRSSVHEATFFVPSPITPMPDRSGRYVMRRRDSSTFFVDKGLAFALSAGAKQRSVRMTLVGARAGGPIGESEQPGRAHHFVGSLRATEMPTYGRIAWEEIYPGVDMVAEPSRGGIAYAFVLSPGARVSDVVLRWEGATALHVLDGARGVDVETGIGSFRVRGLRAFAVEGEHRRELVARHVAHGNELRVEVDGWDGRTPLVIDPTIAWSSYVGGSSAEDGVGVGVDGSGNVFVAGITRSTDLPTSGGFDTTLGAPPDAFVTKLSPSGALLWSTYLGGANAEYSRGLAVDASGNAFVVGDTESTDFPSSGGFDATFGGWQDAFVTKLGPSGALVWSSFLGGAGYETANGVAVDANGNALLTGRTHSNTFPVSGGFDTTLGGGIDAFVTKVSASGALIWSSYLGGDASEEQGQAIAVDANGNAFVTGVTYSIDFPSAGGFDSTYGGSGDAFVSKVSASGALLWSSLLGGNASDFGYGVAVDGSGDAFLVGSTTSADFPLASAFDTTRGGTQDAFVTKVSASGALVWSSLLGGSQSEVAHSVAIDGNGDAVVTGFTPSADFPHTGGFDSTLGGDSDAFVTKVSGAGALLWSSFLGGANGDYGRGVVIGAGSRSAWVVGGTASLDFPLGSTGGGFDTTLVGDAYDAFVTKLTFADLGAICAVAAECRSSYCADGVCCDKACTGRCEACSAVKRGSGSDGACGPVANGSDPDKDCAPQACSAGVVEKPWVCDGARSCRTAGSISCAPNGCAGAACGTSCATDPDCAPSAFCAGTTCTTDLELGDACTRSTQCLSGHCVDGVCCDTSCGAACQACTKDKKGSGVDGACGNVAADTDPKQGCAIGVDACGADGLCDGAGSCRSFAKAGSPCGATSCSAGLVTGRVCRGDGAVCEDGAGVACAPYACGETSCMKSCTSDADCAATAFCSSTKTCVPKVTNGTACALGNECSSNLCVDGVCCNAACRSQCESCNEPGTVGTCTVVIGTPRGGRLACDTLADGDCAKTACDGKVRDKCASYVNGTTTACGEASCTPDKGFQPRGSCDGAGSCEMPTPVPCIPFVCDVASPSGCKARCAAGADCATTFSCSEGVCIQGAKCNAERTVSLDKAGKETSCEPYRCGTNGECGKQCASSTDCAADHLCAAETKVCVAAASAQSEENAGCGCEVGPRPGTWSVGALSLLLLLGRRRRARSRGSVRW